MLGRCVSVVRMSGYTVMLLERGNPVKIGSSATLASQRRELKKYIFTN